MAIPADNSSLAKVKALFVEKFGGEPRVFRAPGRVNLIGEHTDYNDGFVLPAAIDLYAWVTIAPRNDTKLHVFSSNLNQSAEIDPYERNPRPKKDWSDYIHGVALMLQNSGVPLRGANIAIHSDVPSGSGLSSSAAVEVSTASALLAVSNHSFDKLEMALLCQRAENEFVGARCGIMDQFVSVHGQRDHALLLDCRTLEYSERPLPDTVRLVICNTMVRHSVAGGEYNRRRQECEEGARFFAERRTGVKALRDVSIEAFQKYAHELPMTIRKRCRHVISENARVVAAAEALRRHDLPRFGML